MKLSELEKAATPAPCEVSKREPWLVIYPQGYDFVEFTGPHSLENAKHYAAARNALRPMLDLLADLDLLKPPHSDECGCDRCEAYLRMCADRARILEVGGE